MTARGTIVIAGILLSALTLAGCVTVVEPPKAGLTEAEVQHFSHWNMDQSWYYTGISDELRPSVDQFVYVDPSDLGEPFVTCMNEAGYAQYQTESGGYSITDHEIDEQETITAYICTAKYQVDPRDYLLNSEQLGYLYDYYRTTLLPCLARAGFTDVGRIPARQKMEQFNPWNPYDGLPQDVFVKLTSKSLLVQMCPAAPPGSGFEMQWPGDYN